MKTVYRGGTGEIERKKSRFITRIEPAATEEEAQALIASVKKEHWDARHNCSAYILGGVNPPMRCSDDGEPAQTAGRPMLDVLAGQKLCNVCAVVTRYFGGVLLGTGGLVRAYADAVQEGLKNCVIIDRVSGTHLIVDIDYSDLGKIQYLTAENHLPVLRTDYGTGVTMELMLTDEQLPRVMRLFTDQTCGRAKLTRGDTRDFALIDGAIRLF